MSLQVLNRHKNGFHKRSSRRTFLVGLGVLVLAGIMAFAVGKNPVLGLSIAGVSLLVAVICRWPVVGYFFSLAIVLICELFGVDDVLSNYTILPLTNLNFFTPLPLSATPLELILAFTVLISVIRASLNKEHFLDRSLLGAAVGLFGVFLIYGYIWGIYIKHGDAKTALWEIRSPIYTIVLYFLTIHFMREEKYWKVFNWLMPFGLTVLATFSVYRFFLIINQFLSGQLVESLNGLNHEEAILFVVLLMWCFIKLVFGGSKLEKLVAWLLPLPVIFCILVSGRRAAFAVLAGCLILFLVVMYVRKRKAFIISFVILILVFPPYYLAFSKASGPLALPARALSSSSDSSTARDASSDLYRVIEKLDVKLTIKEGPLTGIGFGQPFHRYIPFVDLEGFVFQDYTPHIQILWMWLKVGLFGWMTFLFIICNALFKLGQIVKYEKSSSRLTVCVFAGIIITAVIIYSYYDQGLDDVRLMALLGIGVGVLEVGYRWLPIRVREATERLRETTASPAKWLSGPTAVPTSYIIHKGSNL